VISSAIFTCPSRAGPVFSLDTRIRNMLMPPRRWTGSPMWVHVSLENPGLFVPQHFRSWERKVYRENFCSRGTFVPCNIRYRRTFVHRERTFQELSFLWNCRSMITNIPRTLAPNVLKHDLKLAINYTVAYAYWSPAVNNFQQLICWQCSAGAKALSIPIINDWQLLRV